MFIIFECLTIASREANKFGHSWDFRTKSVITYDTYNIEWLDVRLKMDQITGRDFQTQTTENNSTEY